MFTKLFHNKWFEFIYSVIIYRQASHQRADQGRAKGPIMAEQGLVVAEQCLVAAKERSCNAEEE